MSEQPNSLTDEVERWIADYAKPHMTRDYRPEDHARDIMRKCVEENDRLREINKNLIDSMRIGGEVHKRRLADLDAELSSLRERLAASDKAIEFLTDHYE